jgi:tripartite-type tricarboxylate transporter receptor subunit TctC
VYGVDRRLKQPTMNKEQAMKTISLTLVPLLGLSLSAADVSAQGWPTKPLRAIVPVAAGSSTDVIPRLVLEQLSQQLGQPIVVENRTGAGGTIGTAYVAKSDPDGYTVLVHGAAHTIAPSLYPKLSYHPARDFAAAVPIGISPNVLVVSPTKGFKTIGQLVSAAKASPGKLNFSSVGVGTATHLSAERFLHSAGVQATHVPFRGGAEAMAEVLAGRVDFFFGPVGLVLSNVREGRLAALAVNASERAAMLPNVPTTKQSGFANAEYPIWYGLFLPVKTPRDIVNKLNQETGKTLQAPKLRERLTQLGVDPMVMTPTEFDALVQKEIAINAALVQAIGLRTK